MHYFFKSMTLPYAKEIATWMYPEPYLLYSLDGTDDSIREFMNGEYFFALNATGELVGYICSGESARVPGGYVTGIYEDDNFIDIGLGLRPDLTGKGVGSRFLDEGLQFLSDRHETDQIRLVVATFNRRAMKVYERVGFIKGINFLSKVNNQDIEFVSMTRTLNNK